MNPDTPRLTLETPRLILRLEGRAEVDASLAAMPPEIRAEVSPEWIERVYAAPSPDPWVHGFRVELRETGETVGSCAFKAPPDADGAVEIAYGIEPTHRGRGYATEAAAALVRFAQGRDGVRTVRAHTLPQNGASARVLTRCGFRNVGEVVDPEDGLVWRWEIP